jgi:hypothetical protein
MAAAVPVPVPKDTPTPTTTAGVLAALNILAGPARGGRLRVTARSRSGLGGLHELFLPAGAHRWLPDPVLTLLESERALHVGVAVRKGSCLELQRVCALAAAWRIPRVYTNLLHPESPHGRRYHHDAAGLARAAEKAYAAPWGRPALVVDGGVSLVALWALREPVPVSDAAGAERIAGLHRAVACFLGAEAPPPDLPLAELGVLLPGSVIREGSGGYATCRSLEPSAAVDLADVERALSEKTEEKTKATSTRKEKKA